MRYIKPKRIYGKKPYFTVEVIAPLPKPRMPLIIITKVNKLNKSKEFIWDDENSNNK